MNMIELIRQTAFIIASFSGIVFMLIFCAFTMSEKLE